MLTPGDPQWVRERIGKLTASRMPDVVAKLKKGDYTTARQDYAFDLVAERMTDSAKDHYVTAAMQWGLDHEDEAIDRYEELTGNLCSQGHYVEHPKIPLFGATPDRELLGENGLVEVKCPSTVKFLRWKLEGVVPPEYAPQMLAQLACTGRQFVDFVAFDPRIQGEARHQLFVVRFTPTPEQIAEIETEAEKFLADVDALFFRIVESAKG